MGLGQRHGGVCESVEMAPVWRVGELVPRWSGHLRSTPGAQVRALACSRQRLTSAGALASALAKQAGTLGLLLTLDSRCAGHSRPTLCRDDRGRGWPRRGRGDRGRAATRLATGAELQVRGRAVRSCRARCRACWEARVNGGQLLDVTASMVAQVKSGQCRAASARVNSS